MLLIEQIRGIASAAESYEDSKLLVACANATAAAWKAIDEQGGRPLDESPALNVHRSRTAHTRSP